MAMLKALFVIIVSILAYYVITDQKLNPDEVRGLRVVVTGASYGIGREMARQLARMGAKLVVTARTESKLMKVVEDCRELGSPEAHYIPADMHDPGSPELVIDGALEKLGGIDVLILNHVGGTYYSRYDDVVAMERMLRSNTLSYAHLCARAMPALVESGGRIGVVSSLAGLAGVPYLSHYSASKAALNVYFRSVGLELSINKTDVSVSTFHLGMIDTETGRKNTRGKFSMERTSEEYCASEIIRGTMNREREVCIPHHLQAFMSLYGLIPGIVRRYVLHITTAE